VKKPKASRKMKNKSSESKQIETDRGKIFKKVVPLAGGIFDWSGERKEIEANPNVNSSRDSIIMKLQIRISDFTEHLIQYYIGKKYIV